MAESNVPKSQKEINKEKLLNRLRDHSEEELQAIFRGFDTSIAKVTTELSEKRARLADLRKTAETTTVINTLEAGFRDLELSEAHVSFTQQRVMESIALANQIQATTRAWVASLVEVYDRGPILDTNPLERHDDSKTAGLNLKPTALGEHESNADVGDVVDDLMKDWE